MTTPDGRVTSVPDRGQHELVTRLADPAFHGPHCRAVRVVETHISYVLLTGTFAYKIKKAVKLGFVDFTTLVSRRYFCNEEIRLNRRLAPSIYVDVIAITGTTARPHFGGSGPILEYAVRMREFPQHALLRAVLARGMLTAAHLERLGETVAAFHANAAAALPHTRFGTPADVLELAIGNFTDLQPHVRDGVVGRTLSGLRLWTTGEHARLADRLAQRRHRGHVRDCHGDLHLGNIALIENVATPFDCIEFNDRMRWSDVMSDVAFLTMDLRAHGRADLGLRFLNRYLEDGGDYDGLGVLRFFVVYRAMVRAKVALLRSSQAAERTIRAAQNAEALRFVRVAATATRVGPAGVVIMHGLSGTGKTSVARSLTAAAQGVHVRADVERKRLFGVPKLARTGASIASGIYSAEASRQTYERLAAIARTIVEAGYVAIVDGAFLKRWQRDRLRAVVAAAGNPFAIVDCTAAPSTVMSRLAGRAAISDDASEADATVLNHQVQTAEPLGADEQSSVLPCDTTALAPDDLPRRLDRQVVRLLAQGASGHREAPRGSAT